MSRTRAHGVLQVLAECWRRLSRARPTDVWRPPRDLVAVYGAASEFEASAVHDALTAAGLRAMVRSRRIPGYEVPTMRGDQAGIWADVLVRAEDEDEARRVVAEYLVSLRPADDADMARTAGATPGTVGGAGGEADRPAPHGGPPGPPSGNARP